MCNLCIWREITLGDTDGLLHFIRTNLPLMEPKTADDPLLQGRSAVAQIAYRTGFSSQSHLQTAFKSATGFTPREWRTREIREI